MFQACLVVYFGESNGVYHSPDNVPMTLVSQLQWLTSLQDEYYFHQTEGSIKYLDPMGGVASWTDYSNTMIIVGE